MDWYVHIDGITSKSSAEEIREGLASGLIAADTLVWADGMLEWRPASAVFDIMPDRLYVPSDKTRQVPSLTRLLFGIVAVAAVSILVGLDTQGIFDSLQHNIGPFWAIVFYILALSLIGVVSLMLTLSVWAHPLRRSASVGAGALFVLTSCVSLFDLVSLGRFLLAAPDLHNIGVAVDAYQNAEVTYAGNGTAVILGPIGPALMQDFIALEKSSGPIRMVKITSEGGLVEPALRLARYVESQSITVVVLESCLSACLLIAVASPESYADGAAIFGFHRTTPVTRLESEIAVYGSAQSSNEYRDFLRRHGVPESVLNEAAKHGSDSVYEVTAWEMVRYGAIKGVLSNGRLVKVGVKH